MKVVRVIGIRQPTVHRQTMVCRRFRHFHARCNPKIAHDTFRTHIYLPGWETTWSAGKLPGSFPGSFLAWETTLVGRMQSGTKKCFMERYKSTGARKRSDLTNNRTLECMPIKLSESLKELTSDFK